MIQQSANLNATNSELDAKKIVKNVELTSAQKSELIEQYCELVVDNMDYKTMERYVTETMIDYHSKLSLLEIKEEVGNFDEELYDELVDNVTQQYPKQLNTFGGQS